MLRKGHRKTHSGRKTDVWRVTTEIKGWITKPLLLVYVGMVMKRLRFKKYLGGKNQTKVLAIGMRERGRSRMTPHRSCPRQVIQEDKSMRSFKKVRARGQELVCSCLEKGGVKEERSRAKMSLPLVLCKHKVLLSEATEWHMKSGLGE